MTLNCMHEQYKWDHVGSYPCIVWSQALVHAQPGPLGLGGGPRGGGSVAGLSSGVLPGWLMM